MLGVVFVFVYVILLAAWGLFWCWVLSILLFWGVLGGLVVILLFSCFSCCFVAAWVVLARMFVDFCL